MSNRNLVITGILVILAAIAGGLIYILKTAPAQTEIEKTSEKPKRETVLEEPKEKPKEKPVYQETFLTKNGFSITLPAGWQESSDFPEALLMATDIREEITNEKAKEADFKTYLSIKNDDLGRYDREYSIEEYVDSVKNSLMQIIPSIEFTYETSDVINGDNALFVESESTQNEINFKTLLVFIKGKDNTIWAISFNTLKSSWPTYRDLFYQTAESFELK